MAQATQVILIDDVDGGDADETVTFSFEGVNYEIDLSAANAEVLRDNLGPWVDAARRVSGRAKAGTRARAKRVDTPVDPAAVRAWAASNKIQVSPRGRIRGDVVAQFVEATSGR
jgi:Lsr2